MAKNEISPDSTNAEEILDIDELKKQAEQGEASAQCNLGYCYEYGEGVRKSQKEAIKWYKKSAKQGDETAIQNLKNLGINDYD